MRAYISDNLVFSDLYGMLSTLRSIDDRSFSEHHERFVAWIHELGLTFLAQIVDECRTRSEFFDALESYLIMRSDLVSDAVRLVTDRFDM